MGTRENFNNLPIKISAWFCVICLIPLLFYSIMEINIVKLPKSQIQIDVEIPFLEWEHNLVKAAENLSRDLKIQGFRPGKAPKEFVEKEVGADKIHQEAAWLAIQETYIKVIKEKKLEVIGRPQIEILKLAPQNPLLYRVKTAIMPEVIIGPYKKI